MPEKEMRDKCYPITAACSFCGARRVWHLPCASGAFYLSCTHCHNSILYGADGEVAPHQAPVKERK